MRVCNNRSGTVLIVTIIITFTLAAMVLVLCRSMRVETMAAANMSASVQASAVERGAEQYVIALLTEQPDDVANMSEDQFEAVQVGDGYFWIVRPEYDDPAEPTYGLTEESGKLNLNTASFDQVDRLPGMNYTASSSIMDWKDEDTSVERDGAESDYYLSLPEPYYCKDAPFETVEELLMVKGVDRALLYGDGTAAPLGVRSNFVAAGSGFNDPQISRGIADLVTIYSAEPNTTADGQPRVNVNVSRGDRPRMRDRLRDRLRTRLTASRADEIVALVGDNRLHDIYEMYFRCKMTPDELDQVADDITSSTATVLRGMININTAPRSVMLSLPELDETDVDKLMSARPSRSSSSPNTVSWVADAIGDKAINLGAAITTHTYQYTADIVAASGNGRAFKHVRIVVDARSSTPQIIYRRDVTERGWPMDRQILASLRSGNFASSTSGRMSITGGAR